MQKCRFLISVLFFFVGISIEAQQNLRFLNDSSESESLDYSIYIENNLSLDIQHIKKNDIDVLFTQNFNNLKPLNTFSFWLKIKNNKKLLDKNILEVYTLNATNVKAYGLYENLNQNSYISFTEINLLKHRNDYYVTHIDKNYSDILFHINTKHFHDLIIKAYSQKSFYEKERGLNFYYGFAIGSFLLLFCYHLVLFFKVKDKIYLYYIILIFFSSLLVIPHSGFINIQTYNFYNIVFTAYQIACIGLVANYLSIYNSQNNIIKSMIISTLLINTAHLFFPSVFLKYSTHSISFGIYIWTITATIYVLKNQIKQSIWFILPWAFLFFTHFIYILKIESLFQYRHAIEVGIIMNISLLALAIGNKLNVYKDEKNAAELKELKAFAERELIIQDQNHILEQLINERNSEILEKNKLLSLQKKEIEEKNPIIKGTIQQLELINQQLYNKNNEINQQNIELQKHHELLEIIVNKRTKKLISEKERAIVADKLKTSFLNNLTQEIHTPMNAITGFANMLNDKNLTKEKRNEYLLNINKNVQLLLESIDNVVILARIQARVLKPKISEFNIVDLMTNCYEQFKEKLRQFGKEHISIELENLNNLNNTILLSDYDKIWEIVSKLVDNSVKYTENGKIVLKYNIETNNSSPFLKIEIKDTGIGIQKEKLEFIFERFANIEDDKTKLYHGAGIGLAIVKGMVDILNGKISVISEPNKGSTFQVVLPLEIKI